MNRKSVCLAFSDGILKMDIKRILRELGTIIFLEFQSCGKLMGYILKNPPPPNLIVAETFMNFKFNCFKALRIIRSQYNVPVIFLTSHTPIEIKNNWSGDNCIFLSKPFNTEIFKDSARNILSNTPH